MTLRVRNYTTSKDQEWKAKYFGEAPKPKPQESYSSTTIKKPSGFAQVGVMRKRFVFSHILMINILINNLLCS